MTLNTRRARAGCRITKAADGYTTLGASAGYRFNVGGSQWLAFVNGENLTNQTVRYASSILRDIAPAPGRSVQAGRCTTF